MTDNDLQLIRLVSNGSNLLISLLPPFYFLFAFDFRISHCYSHLISLPHFTSICAFDITSPSLIAIRSHGSEKTLLRPTHWTDTRLEKQLRFAELMGKVSLIPGSIAERVSGGILLDGYQFTNNAVHNATTFATLPLLRPLVRVLLQDLIPQYAGESAETFDIGQDYGWFDDFLQTGGDGNYGDNLAALFLSPGELTRIMRVEVFNSALQNDRILQPQRVPASFYSHFVSSTTASSVTTAPTVVSALPAIPWPPSNRAAAAGANLTRLCHVLVGFDSTNVAYWNSQRAATIFPVVWNEWTLLWEPFPADTFSGYETYQGESELYMSVQFPRLRGPCKVPNSTAGAKFLYCHVTTLRQITYVRVVDAALQPNYAFLSAPLPARADLNYDRVDPDACGTPQR